MSYLVKNMFNGSSANETTTHSHHYVSNSTGVLQSVGSSVKNAINPFKTVQDDVARILLRVQTSGIPRDRREAIHELCLISPNKVAVCVSNEDITMLVQVAELNQQDVQIHVRLLEFLSHLTETEGNDIATYDERSGILDHILEHHAPFLICSLQDASRTVEAEETQSNQLFWIRYYCVKLLQRLQMHDGLRLPKLLIDLQAINNIIDLLKDVSNDGMLRNEGMLLLNALTMTDKELQTMLAFDDCFVTLFDIIQEEGGVEGGIIVIDCLTIISNMLKSNEATQKYFREMDYIVKLRPLLVDCTPTEQGRLTQRGMDVVVFALGVIENLLWHAAATSESDGQKVKDTVVKSGIIGSICHVGLSPLLDNATSVSALRTLAEITWGHRGSCEALLELKMTVQDVSVPALWNLLYVTLYKGSIEQQTQCIQIIVLLIRNSSTGAHTASLLVKNLIPARYQYSHNIDQNDRKQLQGLHCGFLLSTVLFSSNPPTPLSIYCSAVLLNEILGIPQVAMGLLHLPWSDNITFFTAYTSHLCEVIREQMSDIHSTCRMLRPLLTWFDLCGSSISMFLSNLTPFTFFANWCASPPGKSPIYIRFMCAVVCLKACQASNLIDLPPTVRITPEELMTRFSETIGGLSTINDMRFNVGATQEWKNAPREFGNGRVSSILVSTFDDVFKAQIDGIIKHSEDKYSVVDKPESSIDMVPLDDPNSLSHEELLKFVESLNEKLNKKTDECNCLKNEVNELKDRLSSVHGNYENTCPAIQGDTLVSNGELLTTNGRCTLEDRLSIALAERDELLIMVAEIDEERKQLLTQISSVTD